MNKMSALWYEARDAINSGQYLKAGMRKLCKYRKELAIAQPWESDPLAIEALGKKLGMLHKIEEAIEQKKGQRWALVRRTVFVLVTGILATVAGRLIYDQFCLDTSRQPQSRTHSVLPLTPNITENSRLQSPQSGKDTPIPKPTKTPSSEK